MILHGDCLQKLKEMPDNSVDSVVSDPPYGISFMGKKWDYDVPQVEVWKEVLRVLKPGGHALVACGTRTQHRMAVNLEDAGFEIRDIVAWIYSTGFPKSLNVFKQLKKECTCGNMEAYENRTNKRQGSPSEAEHDLRPLSESHLSQEVHTRQEQGEVLQSGLSEQGTHNEGAEAVAVLQFPEGGEQPSVEGRSDIQKTERELQGSNLPEMPAGVSADGEEGRLHNATPPSDGSTPKQVTDKDGSGTPHRPQPEQQQDRKPCAFCKQWGTQATRTLGIGTALKPAMELWTLCRKPLEEKNVAQNVLKYGTGGINIDGCRVAGEPTPINKLENWSGFGQEKRPDYVQEMNTQGRFPANLIHDGSDEVTSGFPNSKAGVNKTEKGTGGIWNKGTNLPCGPEYGDNGSASRFFYCAKASKSERNKGLEGFDPTRQADDLLDNGVGGDNPRNRTNNPKQNFHPTVKPVSLMRYLCRLITPPKGTILDPYMGSGTTGIGAKLEGFDFIGIEREEEYVKIAEARIKAWEPEPQLKLC